MKAIYIPDTFDPTKDLEKLNRELKDCTKIVNYHSVNSGLGTIILAKNHTRKDKLEKIEQISKENE